MPLEWRETGEARLELATLAEPAARDVVVGLEEAEEWERAPFPGYTSEVLADELLALDEGRGNTMG